VPVVDVARVSSAIPRPARSADTPLPGSLIAPTKKPYALYGIAGGGVLVGVIGLVLATRGGGHETVAAQQPQPVTQPQPAPGAAMPAPRESEKISVQLESDVPGAKVTFRRRVAIAPETMQISPTDVVELVEVSAPGYKTQRFWLTFDRPTHLRAHLMRGVGLTEATEEETLVALGEIAAPKPTPTAITKVAVPAPTAVAPAPQAVVKVAPPTEDATVAMAPRKIGHVEDTAAVTVEAPTVDAPPPPATAAIATQVAPSADPSIAAIEVPKTVQPLIDAATVSSVVGSHRPEVLKCFASGKSKDHSMKGTIELQLQVGETGKVRRVQVQSTLKDPVVAACIVKAASAWKFPGHAGGDASVAYPFTFN
jgi:hypothetical protein